MESTFQNNKINCAADIMKCAIISFPFIFFITFITPVIFLHVSKYVAAKIEFCLKSDRHELLSDTVDNNNWHLHEYEEADMSQQKNDWVLLESKISGCPSGILFNGPQQLEAVTSDGEPFCYKESICNKKWMCNVQKNAIVAEIIKIGKPSKNETWTYTEGDSVLRNCSDCMQCQQSPSHSRVTREISGLVPSEPTSTDQIQREVDDQTKRMFYYLAGINQEQVNSHLRVVKLFKMSSQLVSTICDPQYIAPKFLGEIERSFLFLLKEQGFDKLIDLDLETYNQLQKVLEHCAATVKMVKFIGRPCPTGIQVEKMYRIEDGKVRKIMDYKKSSKTFKWGEYDVVLDGAWSTLSIVHAGCFDSFSGKVNLLHKFQVTLEQLFHSALIRRWEHPTQLTDDLFYDSMFMARVNDSLEAMDACARFLYLMTPFETQLNRPIHETFYQRRRKRSVSQKEDYYYEESIGHAFSSLENSIEKSSTDKMDYYGSDKPEFVCLKTDQERIGKVKLVQKREYNDCKNAS